MAPAVSSSRSKKLFITDRNPKSKTGSGPFAAIPNSASSSSNTNAPPREKRTRDLPNLSDCHCCGRRINQTNPKDRLQPLDSVWRVVLICRRCRKSLQSGQMCSYCFRETGDSGNFFMCSVCGRKVHEDCVRDYGNCTPWCYLGAQVDGFRVCVDCWVPDLLKKIRVCGKSKNEGRSKDKGETRDLVEKVAKSGKCEMEKKGKTVEKAKVLKNALDLMNTSLNEKDGHCSKAETSKLNGPTEVVDDADLAVQPHSVMNSSPRILRTNSLVNSNSFDVPSIRKWKGLSYKRTRLGKIRYEGHKLGTCSNSVNWLEQTGSQTDVNVLNPGMLSYKRDKKRKIWPLHDENIVASESRLSQPDAGTSCSMNVSESSNCVYANNKARINFDRFGQALVSYKRFRFKQNICKLNGSIGVSGECGSCDNHEIDFHSDYSQLDNTNFRNLCSVESDGHETCPSRNAVAERDRYQLKYGKRVKGIKMGSSFPHYGTFLRENQACEPVLSNSEDDNEYPVKCDGELVLQNGSHNPDPDRYCFKYTKRVKGSNCGSNFETKLHSGSVLDRVEASAPEINRNCSAESRTLSDVSFDSFAQPDKLNWIREWKGLSCKRSRLGKIHYEGLLAYKQDKKRKIWPLHDENIAVPESRLNQPDAGMSCSMNIPESSSCVYANNKGRTNVDRFEQVLAGYERTRFEQKICEVNGPFGVSGECSSCDNQGVDFESGHCQLDDANLRNCCLVKSDGHETSPSGNADADRDRYQL